MLRAPNSDSSVSVKACREGLLPPKETTLVLSLQVCAAFRPLAWAIGECTFPQNSIGPTGLPRLASVAEPQHPAPLRMASADSCHSIAVTPWRHCHPIITPSYEPRVAIPTPHPLSIARTNGVKLIEQDSVEGLVDDRRRCRRKEPPPPSFSQAPWVFCFSSFPSDLGVSCFSAF